MFNFCQKGVGEMKSRQDLSHVSKIPILDTLKSLEITARRKINPCCFVKTKYNQIEFSLLDAIDFKNFLISYGNILEI